MIKIFFLFFLVSSVYAQPISPKGSSGLETGLDLRLLKKWQRYILVAEARGREEIIDQYYYQALLGSYYRVTRKWRIGLFAQAENGLRWDQDWNNSRGSKWEWDKSQGRWEYSTVTDLTYNHDLSREILLEFKTRFFYYHGRDSLLMKLRPGIKYLFLKEGKPEWQAYSFLETYTPINYGESLLYEYWWYNGLLYQYNDEFSIGPYIALRQRWFHAYDDFKDKGGKDYRKTFSSLYLGLSAVYSF